MKVITTVMPWYAQAGLLVVGMVGAVLMEYLRTVRELEDASDYEDDEQAIEPKPRKTRSRRPK